MEYQRTGTLVRVVAPHFVAGLLIDDCGVCSHAAPILKWAIGRKRDGLSAYFRGKGWKASILK